MSAPGRIRTRDPLLRRHLRWVSGGVLASLYMAFNCTDSGWGWPNVAWKLSAVAPRVAPLIQLAFYVVRMDENNINYELLGTRYRCFSRTATT
jgi:hypothetical protein